jgi:hypothetical protein
VTPSDDLSPLRRPIFFPVVIATVFLTIIGLTAGFMLGERRNNAAGEPDNTPTTAYPTPSSTQPETGKACPPESVEKAAEIGLSVDLRQTMKVTTDKGTIVWICTDGAGGYYYQSQTATKDGELIQGRNGLFLTKVQQVDTDHYEVVDHKGTKFVVTTNRLEVTFVSGKQQIDQVASVE